MKIQFASDLHLEFRENWRYLRDNGPMDVKGDILVLAGDTGYLGDDMYSVHPFWNWASENFKQVLVALGNHEFYKYYDLKTMQDGLVGEIRPNVHYYYNKVVTIQDVDFIISTLWAHIDMDNALVTERGVADFYRIVYGEILDNEPWNHSAAHKKINVDVFHLSGTKPIPVSLQLDLFAKNLLVEEFPSSKEFIKPHKGDDNIWYFDTDVYQIEGVARYYIGLANHIKILNAPELEKFVATFVKENLK